VQNHSFLALLFATLIIVGTPERANSDVRAKLFLDVDRTDNVTRSNQQKVLHSTSPSRFDDMENADVTNAAPFARRLPRYFKFDIERPAVLVVASDPPTVAYRESSTLRDQRAQCDQGNASACVKLADYDRLARSCQRNFDDDACAAALRYQFAERELLTAMRATYAAFMADAEACEQQRWRERCERALAAPIAAQPRFTSKVAHMRQMVANIQARQALPPVPTVREPQPNLATTPSPVKQIDTRITVGQPAPGAATTASSPILVQHSAGQTDPSAVNRAAPQSPYAKMFTTSFFIMLGLGMALALTAALASHDLSGSPSTVGEVSEQTNVMAFMNSIAINPIGVFKLVGTLIVIGLAIGLIFMFTTLALAFFALAGIAALVGYMRYQGGAK
jgi:hypothetical protein